MVMHGKLPDSMGRDSGGDALPDLPVPNHDYGQREHPRKKRTVDGMSRQVMITVSHIEKQALRDHAIRRGVTMAALLREWINPHLAKLLEADSG